METISITLDKAGPGIQRASVLAVAL